MKLNPKQIKFIEVYIANGSNATEAYRKAGYRITTANATTASASRLLMNVNVKAELVKRQTLITSKCNITLENVLSRINDEANNMKSKPYDRLKALELLGKNLQAFTDRIQVEGNLNNTVEINIIPSDDVDD